MKRLQYIYFFSCFTVLLSSCNSMEDSIISYTEINEKDSLRLTKVLFDSMKTEIYANPLYKIKKEDIEDIPICGLQRHECIFNIRINKNGDYMIRSELNGIITSRVYEFYMTNESKNDPGNNFPMYSRISLKEIEDQTRAAKQAALEVENTPGALQDIIDFKWRQVEEWETKKRVLIILGTKELAEVQHGTQIKLDYQSNTKNKNEILDSVLLAFYQMREFSSQRYFKRSYLSLFYEYSETGNKEVGEKLKAINFIHSILLIDKPYCKENGVYLYGEYDITPPPVLIEIDELPVEEPAPTLE